MKKIILIAALALAVVSAKADLIYGFTRQTGFTNLVLSSTTIAANTQTNLTGPVLWVLPGYGVYVQASATGLGTTNTENQTIQLFTTHDGTNFTTAGPYKLTFALNGTTVAIGGTNIPGSTLDGVAAIKAGYYTNGSVNSVSGVTVSLSRRKQTSP